MRGYSIISVYFRNLMKGQRHAKAKIDTKFREIKIVLIGAPILHANAGRGKGDKITP